MKHVICKCGWVSFALTKQEAETEIQRFNTWFDNQPYKIREMYGNRRSSLSEYLCLRCGKGDFKPASQEEIAKIWGCTINPVVYEEVVE